MVTQQIEQKLREGFLIHAFRSGGGLRVLRLEDRSFDSTGKVIRGSSGNLYGYGEAPSVEDAIAYLEEDIEHGGRPYDQVYGKIHPHYWTGSSSASSELDRWLLRGGSFDAWFDGEYEFVCRGMSYNDNIQPITKSAHAPFLLEALNSMLIAEEVVFESKA